MKNLYGRQQKLPPVVLFCLLFYSYFSFFASPSGKMILNTKKKIIMDTPPVMMVIVSPGISISQCAPSGHNLVIKLPVSLYKLPQTFVRIQRRYDNDPFHLIPSFI